MFVFSSFQLDVANASLTRGKHIVLLTPKAFRVLRYLLEHAGQLVTKDDLWRAVWPGISVTDATLTMCVSEIRKALGDDSKTPRYVETVHRLGYRFIAPVSTEPARISSSKSSGHAPVPRPRSPAPHFVGRQAELAQLHECLERALQGERQILFVTGEPGIGKTTLVEEFLRQAQIAARERLLIGRGQCIEHYGAGEAYLPLLDALGRLRREPGGGRLVELLDKHAPAWLVQMPGLLDASELREVQARVAGATRERMLRELTDAIEVISQERTLVLKLEDLHWSDHSTLDWLAFMARRREPARVLVLGSYRPVEVIVRENPLKNIKHELQIHGLSKELPLPLLSEAAVMEYLSLRFTSSNSSSEGHRAESHPQEPVQTLAHTIYERTDGNPLFMVNVVDYLVEGKGLKSLHDRVGSPPAEMLATNNIEMPPGLAQMIEHNIERLHPDEQHLLEAASVAGAEFSSAAVAAALERPISEIEACCTRLARQQQFVQSHGTAEWPDGTVAASFLFLHGLYRDVLHERVPPGRQVELHRRIAERSEQAYRENVDDVAVELAYHYRLGGNKTKAVKYFELAAERARARRAYYEAEQHYRDAIVVVRALPESPERDLRELELRQAAQMIFGTIKGWAAPETMSATQRLRALTEKSGNLAALHSSLLMRAFEAWMVAGDYQTASALADQALEVAERERNPSRLARSYWMQLVVRYWRGDLTGVEEYFRVGLEFFDDEVFKQDSTGGSVMAFGYAALSAWTLGRPDLARQRSAQMMAAVDSSNPAHLLTSAFMAALLDLLMRQYEKAEAHFAQWTGLTEQHQFANYGFPQAALGAVRAQLGLTEGVSLLQEGISRVRGFGIRAPASVFSIWLAEAQDLEGATVDALQTIEQALEANPDELIYRPEALRIRGELRNKQEQTELAETDFRDAVVLAQKMGAKAYELRTTMSLARLLRDTGRRKEARAMLADVYGWFTEGFDTHDLREARPLLDELQ